MIITRREQDDTPKTNTNAIAAYQFITTHLSPAMRNQISFQDPGNDGVRHRRGLANPNRPRPILRYLIDQLDQEVFLNCSCRRQNQRAACQYPSSIVVPDAFIEVATRGFHIPITSVVVLPNRNLGAVSTSINQSIIYLYSASFRP